MLEDEQDVFDQEQEAEAAQYNFAFFMILFITVFTGGYYAYGKIREKFFPQSSSVSDYIARKWRYWDQQVHKLNVVSFYVGMLEKLQNEILTNLQQQYTPLPKEDGDVKQSVSSEAKPDESWDNENW